MLQNWNLIIRCSLVSYPEHSLHDGLTLLQRCSQCILQVQLTWLQILSVVDLRINDYNTYRCTVLFRAKTNSKILASINIRYWAPVVTTVHDDTDTYI